MAYVIILSGGVGSRMKDTSTPKQYKECNGISMIARSLNTFNEHLGIEQIFIVAENKWHSYIEDVIAKNNIYKFSKFIEPGITRQYSILNALIELKDNVCDEDIIVIHDAARPFVSSEIIDECLNLSEEDDGAMPVLPIKDTFYYSSNGEVITGLLDRTKIYAGQSPESFKFGKYYKANINIREDEFLKINGSSEPAVISNMKIKLVKGDEQNFKITTPQDFKNFIEICKGE